MNFICVTCGTQYAASTEPPENCKICDDERQYVGLDGQQWTTLAELRTEHRNKFHIEEPGLTSFSTEPKFGIGQRAFVLQTTEGNLLWDCLSLIDDVTAAYIETLGGLKAIAISHPHYYTTMAEWSAAFGKIPINLHAADREWVMRSGNAIEFWDGETKPLFGELTLIRAGGHFEGGTILHWPQAADGKGALLCGDIIQVAPDRKWVSFMYSYPNYIPLCAATVENVVSAVEPFTCDRIYGAFPGMTIAGGGKRVVRNSADRYIAFLSGSRPGHRS